MDWKRTGFRVLCLYFLSTFALAEITIQKLDDQLVHEGDEVILNCILQNIPQDTIFIFWYHGDTAVAFNDDLTIVNPNYRLDTSRYGQWKLTILQAGIEDQGSWRCQVQSPDAVTEEMVLTVLTPPAITGITQNLSPMPGSTVTLWCNATGSPEPTIKWQRLRPVRSFPLPLGGAYFIGNKLIISEITGEWRGLYHCVASNGVGEEIVSSQVFLQMEYSPTVEAKDGVVSAPRDQSANLVCICQAFPAVVAVNKVMWFKDNNRVDLSIGYKISVDLDTEMDPYQETSVSTLVVESVSDDTLGEYTCRFENLLGYAEAKVSLGVGVVIDPDLGKLNKAPTVMAATIINIACIAIATALIQS